MCAGTFHCRVQFEQLLPAVIEFLHHQGQLASLLIERGLLLLPGLLPGLPVAMPGLFAPVWGGRLRWQPGGRAFDRRVREVRRCPGQTRLFACKSLDSSLQLAFTKREQVFALDQPGLPLLLLAVEAVLSTFEITQRALQMFLLKANAALEQQLFAVEFLALSRKCGGLLEPGVTNVGELGPRLRPGFRTRFRTGLDRIGPSGR